MFITAFFKIVHFYLFTSPFRPIPKALQASLNIFKRKTGKKKADNLSGQRGKPKGNGIIGGYL
jgi:hypothetical protein